MGTNTQAASTMKSFQKGMEIIKMLSDLDGRVTVVAICERLGIPRSTAYRLVTAACQAGMLQPDREPSVYTAGPELRRLGRISLETFDVRRVAYPVMVALSRKTTHSIYLMVPARFEAVCVEKVEGSDGLHLNVELGTRRALHCSGIAKVFLPYLGSRELDEYLSQPLQGYTSKTHTDGKALRREIATIRKQGYAISSGEFVAGARSLGFPLHDHRGTVIAALGVGGATQKLSDSALPSIIASMKEGAASVSAALGYQPPKSRSAR